MFISDILLLDTVYKLLDDPDTLLDILLSDLQKAFDLFSRNVLIGKLNEFKAPHFLVNIIKSFLSNITQVVKYKNLYSDSIPISWRSAGYTFRSFTFFWVIISNL